MPEELRNSILVCGPVPIPEVWERSQAFIHVQCADELLDYVMMCPDAETGLADALLILVHEELAAGGTDHVIQLLRLLKETAYVPIIVVGSASGDEAMQRWFSLGASGYLPTDRDGSLSPAKLMQALDYWSAMRVRPSRAA